VAKDKSWDWIFHKNELKVIYSFNLENIGRMGDVRYFPKDIFPSGNFPNEKKMVEVKYADIYIVYDQSIFRGCTYRPLTS